MRWPDCHALARQQRPHSEAFPAFIITFGFRQRAVFGPRHVAVQTRGHVVTCGLEITRARGRPLAPRPVLTRGMLGTAPLTRGTWGLVVVGAHLDVVAEVGRVVLVTLALGRFTNIAWRTWWWRRCWSWGFGLWNIWTNTNNRITFFTVNLDDF